MLGDCPRNQGVALNIQTVDGRDLGAFIPADLDDLGLDPYEFRIYCRLCRRAGSGVAYESAPNMGTACGISERKVRQVLQTLVKKGLIVGEEAQGHSTKYRLVSLERPTPVKNPCTTCSPAPDAALTPAPHAGDPCTTCSPTPAPPAPKGSPSEGNPIKEEIGARIQKILGEVPAFAKSAIPLKSFEEIAEDFAGLSNPVIVEQARLARDWALEAPRYKPANAKGNPATFFRSWLKRKQVELTVVPGGGSSKRTLTAADVAVIHR